MRKLRDFGAEMKALTDKAKLLEERKVHQLGELVIATGADALTIEQLAGLLIAGMDSKGVDAKENWHKRGATFFQKADCAGNDAGSVATGDSSMQKDGS